MPIVTSQHPRYIMYECKRFFIFSLFFQEFFPLSLVLHCSCHTACSCTSETILIEWRSIIWGEIDFDLRVRRLYRKTKPFPGFLYTFEIFPTQNNTNLALYSPSCIAQPFCAARLRISFTFSPSGNAQKREGYMHVDWLSLMYLKEKKYRCKHLWWSLENSNSSRSSFASYVRTCNCKGPVS